MKAAAKGTLGPRKKKPVPVPSSSSSSEVEEESEIQLHDEAVAHEVEDREVREEKEKEKGEEAKKKEEKKKRKVKAERKRTSVVQYLFRKSDKPGKYVCDLQEFMDPASGHPLEVAQMGKTTSNLLEHARKYHGPVVDGLVKAYNEGRDVGQEYKALRAVMAPPKPVGMERFVSVTKRSDILLRRHLSLLTFLIANQLPFNVINSKQFTVWMGALGIEYPSAATMKKLLAPFHEFVVKQIEKSVIGAGFFSTTFDLWTSNTGNQYLAVTYHSMDKEFNLIATPLDLIPVECSTFGEFIYLAVQARIKAHGFDDSLYAAAFSDSGSNVVLAKSYLTSDDAEPCFNHDLKHVIEDVLVGTDATPATCPRAAKDCAALALMITFVRASDALSSRLARKMKQTGSRKLKLIQFNATRWEKPLCLYDASLGSA